MNFIKKVFDKKPDEDVHLQFQKFSRGEFRNRAVVRVKKVKDKYTLLTTAEFANGLVKDIAEKLGDNNAKVTGGIISTINLKEIPEYKEFLKNAVVKQFQGVKNFQINSEISGNDLVKIIKGFPKAFFALSFDSGKGDVLKIKPKAPKSGKPGSKGEEAPKPDFCKLVTNDEKIAKEFIFENITFKEADINHTFFIDSIVIPNELKSEKDFAIVREKSLRKGRIVRKTVIDGKESVTEFDFEA
jgi:hypothetical protein